MSFMMLVQIGILVLSVGYSAYNAYQMKKRTEKEAADSASPIPYITESDVIPVVFGTIDIVGPAIVEATGPRGRAPEPAVSSGDIKRWWEWNYVRVVLCHGRIDGLSIFIDGELRQVVTLDANYGIISADGGKTNKQILLGWYSPGVLTPPAPPTPAASLSDIAWQGQPLRLPGLAYALIEAWRYGIKENDSVFAFKPQFPSEVTWRVQRALRRHGQAGVTGWTDELQWLSAYSQITLGGVVEMNPAHIIRDVLTDRVWGLGVLDSDIDEDSFAECAEAMFDDEFGLSYLWARETSAADFILEILRHIDGLLFQEPSTGKYVLRLIRQGSNTQWDLRSPAIVTAAPDFSRPSYSSMATRVTVIFRSRTVDREASVTVHDQALIEQLGDVPVTIRYDGVYSSSLAARIAARDLRRLSTPLASVRMSVTWDAGKDIRAGDRVLWSWPQYGVTVMALRVSSVTYGELDSSSVTLELIEDVLAPTTAIYAPPAASAYVPPNYTAVASEPFAVELPIALSGIGSRDIGPSDTRGSVMTLTRAPAIRPSLHVGWDLVTGGVTRREGLRLCATITLDAAISYSGMSNPSAPTLTATPSFALSTDVDYLCVFRRPDGSDEFCVLRQTSAPALRMTRGAYDTTVYYGDIPVGTIIFALSASSALNPLGGDAATDGRPYVAASVIETRALTRTSQDTLPIGSSTAVSTTIANRQVRPTCPGFTAATFTSGTGTTISWRRRNRLVSPTCTQACPDISPEDGTTHKLIIEGLSPATGGVFVEVQNLSLASTVTNYLYATALEDFDHKTFPGGAGNFAELRMTLYSIRDGYESWQRQIRVRT